MIRLPANARLSTHALDRILVCMVAVLSLALPDLAAVDIPAAARNDPRYALGYLVVTHYPGVKNDGTGDSTAGIQQAIDDAIAVKKVVFLPAGTYLVSDTLKCYHWLLWDPRIQRQANQQSEVHLLTGSVVGAARPVIKLAANAPLFDNAGKPRPIVNFRLFRALNSDANTKVEPADPLGDPANFVDGPASLFYDQIRGIDIDCSGHAGAIGLHFRAAQSALIADVSVKATGAYAGIQGLPGRNAGGMNLEVIGGRYGIMDEGSIAGTTAVGVRLINQTQAAVKVGDFCPLNLVGFEIIKDQGSVIEFKPAGYATSPSTLCLLDGTITIKSGTAVVNPEGKNIYIRNVYVSGSNNVIQSGSRPVVTRTGTWKRIAEYVYCDQLQTAQVNHQKFESFNVINGVKTRTAEPVTVLETVTAPPTDLRSRHVYAGLPQYEGQNDGTIVVTKAPYNATANDTTDDRAAIQKAIDDAAAAGHGRVFIPSGEFQIGNSLTLHKNTVMFGVGKRRSEITVHDSWQPTTGQATMIVTDDDASATTFLGFLQLNSRSKGGVLQADGAWPYDRFGFFLWRAGRYSATMGLVTDEEWHDKVTNPRRIYSFTGHGGGRHYFLEPSQRNTANAERLCVYVGGTTEPLWFYGLNMETTKRPFNNQYAKTNCEIVNARNVIILGIKREGASPSVIIRNSTNIAFYGSGAMRSPAFKNSGGYVQVLGTSNNIVVATVVVQSNGDPSYANGEAVLSEKIDGHVPVAIVWPNNVAIYKRGEVNDAALYIAPKGSTPPPANQPPVIQSGVTATPNPVVNANSTSLFVTAIDPDNGPSAMTYTWSKVSGPGTMSFAPNGTVASSTSTVTFSASGTYAIQVSASDGASTVTGQMTGLVVTLPVAPSITTQPANKTVTAGQTATFTVTAAGTAPLTYQWKKGTANVGSNSNTLTIANAQAANAGTYTVVVSNSAGSVTSHAAILTVQPVVATNPVTVSLAALTFNAAAGGTAPVTVTFTLTNTSSSPVTVAPSESLLWLTVTPASATLAPGGTATFTAVADPTGLSGTVSGSLMLSNSPGGQSQTLPVTLSLTTTPLPPPTGSGAANTKPRQGGCTLTAQALNIDGLVLALGLIVLVVCTRQQREK